MGEVFNRTLPQGPGERNNRLWDLARGLRINLGLDLAAAEPIVREWHRRALAHVTTRDFGTTWAEYCRAHERARFPLGADPLRVAAAMVRRGELPPVASAFQSEATRKLIALCESLARLNADGGRFFLSSHVAAEIIDRKQPQTLGLLHRLCERGVIALTERGNRFRANRYVWLAGGTGKGDGR